MRTGRLGAIVGLALMAIVLSLPVIESEGLNGRFVATAALVMAGLLIVLGSRVLQNDMRQDAEHLPTLKVLPLSGARVVAAEVISSALPIIVMQVGLVVIAYVAVLGDSSFLVRPTVRSVAMLLMPILLLAINVTTVTIQNGAALLFPGWVRVSPVVGGGVEAMGQGILATGMLLLTFVVALLPALVVGGVIEWVLSGLWVGRYVGAYSWTAAVLASAATLLAEAWWAIRGLGRRFEKMEPQER
jgi:hypothetical protein